MGTRYFRAIKNRIKLLYHNTIGRLIERKRIKKKYHLQRGKRNIVIWGTPNHDNLGDYAIAEAEKVLFHRYAPECNLFCVDMTDSVRDMNVLKKLLKAEDMMILTGGGNLGNQYMDDERIRRNVIQNFPHCRVVLFPQTMYFTPDEEGIKEQRQTREIYNAHKDLWMAARDKKSYNDMKELFSCQVRLLPDVVLTMKPFEPMHRQGALLVLRSDLESTLNEEKRDTLKRLLKDKYGLVKETDTTTTNIPKHTEIQEMLMAKWKEFQQAQLIVTDRLHGMIFAALAQTPCIVLSNYNHKLRETWRWLRHLDYVVYLENGDSLETVLNQMQAKTQCTYAMPEIEKQYDSFMKEILYG